jgi:hypothetical protein
VHLDATRAPARALATAGHFMPDLHGTALVHKTQPQGRIALHYRGKIDSSSECWKVQLPRVHMQAAAPRVERRQRFFGNGAIGYYFVATAAFIDLWPQLRVNLRKLFGR